MERDTPPPPSTTLFPLTPPKMSPLKLGVRESDRVVVAIDRIPLETPPESPELPDETSIDAPEDPRTDEGVEKALDREEKDEDEEEKDEVEEQYDEVEEVEAEDEEIAPYLVTPPMMDHEYCLSPPPASSKSSHSSPASSSRSGSSLSLSPFFLVYEVISV